MDLTVTLDARYAVTPDGEVWSQFGMAQRFWERYLTVFDRVHIVARAVSAEQRPEGSMPVTGPAILFHAIPDYRGPWEFVKRYQSVRRSICNAFPDKGAVIMRVGSEISNGMARQMFRTGRPFALEVIGDPNEVFAPGVIDHPFRGLFRWYFSRQLRRQCLRANGVAYVTRSVLQQRYPTRSMGTSFSDVDLPEEALFGGASWTHYSSVEIDSGALAERRREPKQAGPYQLLTVGSLAQLYKGADVLIDAIALCVRSGCELKATVLGDGVFRDELIAHARRKGLGSHILFPGHVPAGEPVRKFLDAADLFILPSRTEGLPRALVEAMARSLPCIGTAVGGIPELLQPDELVPAGSPIALAAKIMEVLRDPQRMAAMSRRNLKTSLEYRDCVLAERRRRFYQYVKDFTADWEATREARLCASSIL